MELSALRVESSFSVPGLDSTSEEKGFPSTVPCLEQKQKSHGEENKQLLERSTSDCASLVTNAFMSTAVSTEKEVCLQGQNGKTSIASVFLLWLLHFVCFIFLCCPKKLLYFFSHLHFSYNVFIVV